MHSVALTIAQNYLWLALGILAIGLVGSRISARLRIPDIALFLLLGVVFGRSGIGWLRVPVDSPFNQLILVFGAAFILFHGGTVTQFAVLRQVWRTILLLGTVGVLVTAVVTGIGAYWLLGLPWLLALLLGAILASTDPAALVPVFQRFQIRSKIAQTVISESAFTDATATILTLVVFGLASGHDASWTTALADFARLALGGIAIGSLIGLVGAFLLSEHDHGLLRDFSPVAVLVMVLGSYLIAERVQTNGFMAVFVAGLFLGNARSLNVVVDTTVVARMHHFVDDLALKLRMFIFVLLGSQVDFGVVNRFFWPSLGVVAIFILLARPLTVLCCTLPDRQAKWSRNETMFLFWTRETGVIPAALVGLLAGTSLPDIPEVTAVTFVAILCTLLIQPSTTGLIARRLHLMSHQNHSR